MAKEFPPYISSTGLLQDLLVKIKEAPPPPRFSQDYLFSSLKFKKSGSTIPFIPFLKRIGFLGNDGTPSEIYKKFRNPSEKTSGKAMAQAIKIGYSDLYTRNEYWHKLSKDDLKNFLIEVLEVEATSGALRFLIATIDVLKKLANFEEMSSQEDSEQSKAEDKKDLKKEKDEDNGHSNLNLSYTINLNLPETSDIKVFDAIFKSLKEHILKKN